MPELAGKVALVTGAAVNIGAAIAELLIDRGAVVVVSDIDVEKGMALVERLGASAHFRELDVAESGAWEAVMAEIEPTFGGLDILVNNAAAGARGFLMAEDTWDAEYRRIVATTQDGTFFGTRAAIKVMRRKGGGGSIVNISSIDGLMGVWGQPVYSAAKAAVLGLTRAVAIEVAQHGIRVNAVSPGAVSTPQFRDFLSRDPYFRDAIFARVPMARLADPREIAEAVAFLASDRSSFCTGTEITVDGGCVASTWTNVPASASGASAKDEPWGVGAKESTDVAAS